MMVVLDIDKLSAYPSVLIVKDGKPVASEPISKDDVKDYVQWTNRLLERWASIDAGRVSDGRLDDGALMLRNALYGMALRMVRQRA